MPDLKVRPTSAAGPAFTDVGRFFRTGILLISCEALRQLLPVRALRRHAMIGTSMTQRICSGLLAMFVLGLAPASTPRLVLIEQHPAPVITTRTPGAKGNKYGFEGGRVVRVRDTYHLFTSEMIADPIWVKMRLAHWRSDDRLHWTRVSTLFESSGEFAGADARASLWSPLPVYDDRDGRWDLFYVAYHAEPNTPQQFRMNEKGRIWRAVSQTKGIDGVGGPYRDVAIVMQPGPDSQPWEGLQGTDSFFPYKVGARWLALYGSANTESTPIQHWRVGLASAPAISGPWTRRQGGDLPIEPTFIENPIVERLRDGSYAAVYDTTKDPDAIGFSWSKDGSQWSAGQSVAIQRVKGKWSPEVRTPLGLVPEVDGTYSVFYTGFEQPADWNALMAGKPSNTFAVGFARLRMQ